MDMDMDMGMNMDMGSAGCTARSAAIALGAVVASGRVAKRAADCGVRRGECAVRVRGLSVRLVGAVRSLM